MKPFTEQVFLGELAFQAKIAQRSADSLSATQNHSDHIEVWRSIQSLLVAAGNISKILWPSVKANKARGEKLRTILSIDERNPLSIRKFRDHFEHYDERIEKWLKNTASAVYVDLAIDPLPYIWGAKLDARHRVYNPVTRTLTFRGESIDLAEIIKAIEEVRQKCGRFVLT
jgi:hypothetical protein